MLCDLGAPEASFCGQCRVFVLTGDYPVHCVTCGKVAELRYIVPLPQAPPFGTRVKIEREGRVPNGLAA
jgi:hypothetical protein